MRILAYKVPKLREFAHDQKLQNVESAIIEHYGAAVTEEEKQVLQRSRCLRNKILHCDFRAARRVLGSLGIDVKPAGIKQVDVRNLPVRKCVKKLPGRLREKKGKEGCF